MTTKEMIRCKDCGYLVENDNGDWICDDCGFEIHEVDDLNCAIEQEEWEFDADDLLDAIKADAAWVLDLEPYSDEWFELMDI